MGRPESAPDSRRAPPAITLPRGGGAIRGIGETFSANPVTGTSRISVPLPLSPGRNAFTPALELSYDSGAGNGPFGFGWSLGLPAVTRRTDDGLPRYDDAAESDVFVLSGAEDLVPALRPGAIGLEHDRYDSPDGLWTILAYRPRIEGLFARIERWTEKVSGDTYWRTISRDNLTTLYGRTPASRLTDPEDASRVFTWLICETFDNKGNTAAYEYKPEDAAGVDTAAVHERNRTPRGRAANRYLKRVRYGNVESRLIQPDPLQMQWLFEVVFDYGEHHASAPRPDDAGEWLCRHDPFSSYRSGFDVRTYRLCQRVLMFHHFPAEADVGSDCLVKSLDLTYRSVRNQADDERRGHPVASFVASMTVAGFRRAGAVYLRRAYPPLEFGYSEVTIDQTVRELDAESRENLPIGVDGRAYRFVDLDGEGIAGVLSEQAGAWFYKPGRGGGRFGATRRLGSRPSLGGLNAGRQQLLDLAGDGSLDLVDFDRPVPGYYERTADREWDRFTPFRSVPNLDWDDPNLRFVDLDGDGRVDVLIAGNDAFTWLPSRGQDGFGDLARTPKPSDLERGPALVFADATESVHLADLSGDGLADLVRIRNGEVSYWPNLGYGRFGPRVTMSGSPRFDASDQFDPRRVLLGDIDGSGNTDLLYLGRQGVDVYLNESGNAFAAPQRLDQLPALDGVGVAATADVSGDGTASLVWSSPLPRDATRPLRYVHLMSAKPHLLVAVRNNLGAETRIRYRSSTAFYLSDRADGRPWITRLPFPVHVVDRVETYDWIARNRFVTEYAYHHGYFDGIEREFRGFGLVEQWDTEQLGALGDGAVFPIGDNANAATHVAPVHTKTWYHTGVFSGRDRVSNFFAGLVDADDPGEYYREPGLTDADARARLLDDTVLPADLLVADEPDAVRALKGSVLRQEVYARDGTPQAAHPYSVSERNYAVRLIQARGPNRHAVFVAEAFERLDYQYERNPADPRLTHALVLETDRYGNVLKRAAVGYPRRQEDLDLPLQADRDMQRQWLATYTESDFTIAVETPAVHLAPLPAEQRTYELTGYVPSGRGGRFQPSDFVQPAQDRLTNVFDTERDYDAPRGPGRQRRLIERTRTQYRPDDFGAPQNDPLVLLPPGALEPLALLGERYTLAFTPGLIARVYQRPRVGQPVENLLPNPAGVLAADVAGGQVADRGGYVDLDGDGHWWIPAGRGFYSPNAADGPAAELAYARQHFFLPVRGRDQFGATATIVYDAYNLLGVEVRDAVGNVVTAGERDAAGLLVQSGQDYRVLQPRLVMDANGNRAAVAFDTLGMVAGTAVMGKPAEALGDTLAGFVPDLTAADTDAFYDAPDPRIPALALLGHATTRIVYDIDRFRQTRAAFPHDSSQWQAVYAATIARASHVTDPLPPGGLDLRLVFSFSDGLGREIQRKVEADTGPLVPGGPDVDPRWVGSGWTIFNNKGQPVRRFEPFFSQRADRRHQFEFGAQAGVSPILFYDPLDRVVATLHPNHTYEKAIVDAWRQTLSDVNDTVRGDPRIDPEVRGLTANYFAALNPPPGAWQTWYEQRQGGALGVEEQQAAAKADAHANTPAVTWFDPLARAFLTVRNNGPDANGQPQRYVERRTLDIEGNQREVRDPIERNADQGRLVLRTDYDMAGRRMRDASMDAGERWMLDDVGGRPIRRWDSRARTIRTEYDPLRRPIRWFVIGADRDRPDQDVLVERLVYGEQHPDAAAQNLRGRLFLHFDPAGVASNDAHDFTGNLIATSRRFAVEYRRVVDWRAVDAVVPPAAALDAAALAAEVAPRVDADTFTTRTTFDALGRVSRLRTPDDSVTRPTYTRANLLERVDVNLRGARANGAAVWTPFIVDVEYNARGQRTRIAYGNGVSTVAEYDPLTFRLTRLRTARDPVVFDQDCPQPALPQSPGCGVQHLHYVYDPAGNITAIRDTAQQQVFFRNQRVDPSADFSYDAIYRLIEAHGREHLGLNGALRNPPTAPEAFNQFHMGLVHRGDGSALGTYVEQYEYDAAGNLRSVRHRGSDPAHAGWTRLYTYADASLLEPLKSGNRLSATSLDPNIPLGEPYRHDAHGNITRMPHLAPHADPQAANLHWNHRDQLQQVDLGGGGTAYYVDEAQGGRARKVWEKGPGLTEERLSLNGFEVFRRRDAAGAVVFTRETLHVRDDRRRIAMIETVPPAAGAAAAPLVRYQFDNHLGTVSLELDDNADVISYEEYSPYGSTVYQAARNQAENPKRYRFAAEERDEESGFYYQQARYSAPWLGRWISADPGGLIDGPNLYAYVRGNPVRLVDPSGTAPPFDDFIRRLEQLRTAYEQNEATRPSPHRTEAAVAYELEYSRIQGAAAELAGEGAALRETLTTISGGELHVIPVGETGAELSIAQPVAEKGSLSVSLAEGDTAVTSQLEAVTDVKQIAAEAGEAGDAIPAPVRQAEQAAEAVPEQLQQLDSFEARLGRFRQQVAKRAPVLEAEVETAAKSTALAVRSNAQGERSLVQRATGAGSKILRFFGRFLIVLGASEEADKSFHAVEPGFLYVNAYSAYINTFVFGLAAGVIDDAAAAMTLSVGADFYLERYEGFAGPLQHIVGRISRGEDVPLW